MDKNSSVRINRTDWLNHVSAYLKKTGMSKAQVVRNSQKLPKPYQCAKSYVYHQMSTSPRERINPTKTTCYKLGMALGMSINNVHKWVSTMKPALTAKLPKATKRGINAKKSETAKSSHNSNAHLHDVKASNTIASHKKSNSAKPNNRISMINASYMKDNNNSKPMSHPNINRTSSKPQARQNGRSSESRNARENLYGKYVHVLMSRNHINKRELASENTFDRLAIQNFINGKFSNIPTMTVNYLLKELNTNLHDFIRNAYKYTEAPTNKHLETVKRHGKRHSYIPVRHHNYDNIITSRAISDIKKLGDGDTQMLDNIMGRVIQCNYTKHDIADLQSKYMGLKSKLRIYKVNYDNLQKKYVNLKKLLDNEQPKA